MFDEIVKSVLTELSADKIKSIYDNYYSSISRSIFDEIVTNYGLDKIVKKALDYIKENNNNESYRFAKKFLERYKNAKNEIRIELTRRFQKGEYEDIVDMNEALNEFETNGVETLRSIQNTGYIVVYEDEKKSLDLHNYIRSKPPLLR